MKRPLSIILLSVLAFAACNDSDDVYPDIITQFVEIQSDAQGALTQITTDYAQTYQISNPIEGYTPQTTYRVVCGYALQDDKATIYQLMPVYLLRDSTLTPARDPITLLSVWQAGEYINMQLAPRTHGEAHGWGFIVDSIRADHIFLSLHHRQGDDMPSYTQNVYASILLSHINEYSEEKKISLTINTFDGPRTYDVK